MRRLVIGLGLFLTAAGALILSGTRTAEALRAADKDSREEKQLRKQVVVLQQELREREQTIARLRAELKKEKGPGDAKEARELRRDLTAATQALKDKDELIAALKKKGGKDAAETAALIERLRKQVRDLEGMKNAPYVHTVIIKMKKDAPAGAARALLDDIPAMLGKIPSIKGLWYGPRADEVSPEFAVKDFSAGLVILFDDYDGLKRYLDHPMHVAFLEKHIKNLEAPLVYDCLKPLP